MSERATNVSRSPDAPRRRRYSLRALFVSITVAACFCGWVVSQMHQRDALLESLRSRGVSKGITFWGRPAAPRRFVWLQPASWFYPVRSISYEAGELTPDEIENLRRAFPEAELFEYIPNIHVLPSSIPPVGVHS